MQSLRSKIGIMTAMAALAGIGQIGGEPMKVTNTELRPMDRVSSFKRHCAKDANSTDGNRISQKGIRRRARQAGKKVGQ